MDGPESKVPDLPIFLRFTLRKVGRPDLISIPGMAWSMQHLSTRQTAQKTGRIFRGLEKKPGSWYTEPMEWHNLTIDTDQLAGCLFPAPQILVKLSETEEIKGFCSVNLHEMNQCDADF